MTTDLPAGPRVEPSLEKLRFLVTFGDWLGCRPYRSLRQMRLAGFPYSHTQVYHTLGELDRLAGGVVFDARRVALTPLGAAYLAWARRVFAAYGGWPPVDRPVTTIGVTPDLAPLVLARVAGLLAAPDAADDLVVRVLAAAEIRAGVRDGRFPFGVLDLPPAADERLHGLRYAAAGTPFPYRVALRRGHRLLRGRPESRPFTPADLADAALAIDRADLDGPLAGWLGAARGRVRLTADGVSAVLAAVRSSNLIAIVPQYFPGSDSVDGTVIRRLDPEDALPPRRLSVCTDPSAPPPTGLPARLREVLSGPQ